MIELREDFIEIPQQRIKTICFLPTYGMQQYDNNEKVDQRGMEAVLSFCIEERYNTSDGWCINPQN